MFQRGDPRRREARRTAAFARHLSRGGAMKRNHGAAILSLVGLLMLAPMPIAAQQPDVTQSSSARFHRKGDRAIPNPYIGVLERDAVGRGGESAVNPAELRPLMPGRAATWP